MFVASRNVPRVAATLLVRLRYNVAMSRVLKLLAGTFVATAGVAIALAAAGPASAPAIICPLEPAQTITTPCCGPPILAGGAARPAVIPCCVCCLTPTAKASPALIICLPLTISASPDPSTAGRTVTVSGHWSAGTAGVTVVLWQKLPGSKTFTQVGTATTDSLGNYRFVRTGVNTNRQWYVTAMSTHSFTVDEGVHAVVTLSRSLHVAVSPNHDGEHVLLQERNGHAWSVIAHIRLPQSTLVFISLPQGKTIKLRAVLPADKRNVRSVSNVVSLTS
jgi:hypothetical protein